MLRHRPGAGLGRRPHLLVRMHVLRGVLGADVGSVSQLRRRTDSPSDTSSGKACQQSAFDDSRSQARRLRAALRRPGRRTSNVSSIVRPCGSLNKPGGEESQGPDTRRRACSLPSITARRRAGIPCSRLHVRGPCEPTRKRVDAVGRGPQPHAGARVRVTRCGRARDPCPRRTIPS